MKILIQLVSALLLFILASCAPSKDLFFANKNTAECKSKCLIQYNQCSQKCTDTCRTCRASGTAKATEEFKQYLHEKRVEGGYIARNLNSYRDPLQCRKVTCNCAADMNTCNQACGGVIHKKLMPVPYCN